MALLTHARAACASGVERMQMELTNMRLQREGTNSIVKRESLAELDDTLRAELDHLHAINAIKSSGRKGKCDESYAEETCSSRSTPENAETVKYAFNCLYGTGPGPGADAPVPPVPVSQSACWDHFYGAKVSASEPADLSGLARPLEGVGADDDVKKPVDVKPQLRPLWPDSGRARSAAKRFRRDSLTFEMVEETIAEPAVVDMQVHSMMGAALPLTILAACACIIFLGDAHRVRREFCAGGQ